MPAWIGEKVESYKWRGYLCGQLAYSRCCGMQPKLQGVEWLVRDYKLSVQHEPRRLNGSDRLGHFWKVPFKRFLAARLEMNLITIPEDDAPKPSTFGSCHPLPVGGSSSTASASMGSSDRGTSNGMLARAF
jgi:hypothetical protein